MPVQALSSTKEIEMKLGYLFLILFIRGGFLCHVLVYK